MEREGLSAGLFRPEDGEGVAKLFAEIYGDAYPAKIVYHPDELVRAFEKGDEIPIVVRTEDSRIVGYSSLFRPAPHKGVWEKGNGAVLPEFRNAGVMGMVFQFLKELLPGRDDIDMFLGEPVCNHTHMQKAASILPMVETALEIDLMPRVTYEKEKSASGRVSALLVFMTLTPRPHTVHIPPMYGEQLKYIYDGLDDRRSFSESGEDLPESPATRIVTDTFGPARVGFITVHEAGADFRSVILSGEERLPGDDVDVIQVRLKLSRPWIGKVTRVLKDQGYFFGGILPQWFGEDGLLMQKVRARPNWEGIHLASERAKKILEFVKEDWQRP